MGANCPLGRGGGGGGGAHLRRLRLPGGRLAQVQRCGLDERHRSGHPRLLDTGVAIPEAPAKPLIGLDRYLLPSLGYPVEAAEADTDSRQPGANSGNDLTR